MASRRTHPITVVELDIPYCSLTYGSAPCTAAVGVTGAAKCFNTTRTCQDPANFARTVKTLRFCQPFAGLTFDAHPALKTVNPTPCTINPGKDMGTRGTVKVTIADFPYSDAGFDKYIPDRGYDPYLRGTYLMRLRARVPSFESYPLRILRGYQDMDLADFTVEHYLADSALYDADGVTLTGKDPLSLCDTKKSQAPNISNGRLLADISAGTVAATLTPTGVGNLEYPTSGLLTLSGKEIVSFTRVGDALTILRGQQGSTAIEHKADSIVQLCLVYSGASPADILYDLLANYTEAFDPAWINLPAWQDEVNTYVGHLFSTVIPTPTSVATLINEVIEQAGLAMWWDLEARECMLQSLRPIVPESYTYEDSQITRGSLAIRENPDMRVSQAWTHYGPANYAEKLDKVESFRAASVKIDDETVADYDVPAIRKTLCRWIGIDNRPAAVRLNEMLIARFKNAPRSAQFDLFPTVRRPRLGSGIFVQAGVMQDASGAPETVPYFVTALEPTEDRVQVTAVEFKFSDSVPSSDRSIFIDADTFNINLWDLYTSLYATAPADLTLDVYFSNGAWVGSRSVDDFAFTVPDDFPAGAVIRIHIGTGSAISGAGGKGAGVNNGALGDDAQDGGPGLLVERPVEIFNLGRVQSGGGGGGLVRNGFSYVLGGGGGAGFQGLSGLTRLAAPPGQFSGGTYANSQPGGTLLGGPGGTHQFDNGITLTSGNGGDAGAAGQVPYAPTSSGFSTGAAGQPGNAVDGDSFITWTTLGTIRGPRVN
jgi:hypothetical protein